VHSDPCFGPLFRTPVSGPFYSGHFFRYCVACMTDDKLPVKPHLLHNKRLRQSNWYMKYQWSQWPPQTLRGAIIRVANFERRRHRADRRQWWFWQGVRVRMTSYYAVCYGPVPGILLQRRVPDDRFALSRDRAFNEWWRGLR